jgi:hypothetical protein
VTETVSSELQTGRGLKGGVYLFPSKDWALAGMARRHRSRKPTCLFLVNVDMEFVLRK